MRTRRKGHRPWMFMITALVVSCSGASFAHAQTFDSGSNGSDGALNLVTPGTIEFDPVALGLDTDGDNIYHFTTINIGPGVIVRLTARKVNAPVFWLASGAVQIDGTIDLNGENGQPVSSAPGSAIFPSLPGAGGYPGGVPGQAGSGPLGGVAPRQQVQPTCFVNAGGGRGSGNAFLTPLIGGSGGGGGYSGGRGGGAGGGALLMASSASIVINGTITANGGTGSGEPAPGSGGGGSGGGIHLIAPSITGGGMLRAKGTFSENPSPSCSQPGGGAPGVIRLEAFQQNFTGSAQPQALLRTPFGLYLPTVSSAPSSIRAVKVNGVDVPPNPTGSFEIPDVTINQSSAVTVEIEAHNVPEGTVAQLYIFSENGSDQIKDSTPLTAQPSGVLTATASVTLPPGFSRGYVRAMWTNP